MLVSYKWLKKYVDVDINATQLAHRITMGGVEVESVQKSGDDFILDISPTPNRGDCLSIIGVAKEVAALLGEKVKTPNFTPPKGRGKMSSKVSVLVKDKNDTPRYTARLIEGVKVGPSPAWLREGVESAGIRSINNVVDATNFVLMELGQPVHAFDIRFLKGAKLIIDRPKKPCKIVTLDGIEREFGGEDILNMDGERAIGVAGIMGAENSGVQDDTTTLVLESAYFNPVRVRRTSKRTGLSSESLRRFEKGVDPQGVIDGLHRLTGIIVEVAGGTPSEDWVDFYPVKMKIPEIKLTAARVNWLLGTELSDKTIVKILKGLGCDVTVGEKGAMKIVAPSHRPDLTRPIDLVEEIARFYGYDKIAPTMPIVRTSSLVMPPLTPPVRIAREQLVNLGFFETISYSFTSLGDEERFGRVETAVKLSNPLTNEMEYMRTTLIPSLVGTLAYNLNRQATDIKLFEVSRTFYSRGSKAPGERLTLAGIMTGRRFGDQWASGALMVDLGDAKAAVWAIFSRLGLEPPEVAAAEDNGFLNPMDSLDIMYGGERIGHCGRLHPDIEKVYDFKSPVYVFELFYGPVAQKYLDKKDSYEPVSRYPFITRDVALLVDLPITHKDLLQYFNKHVSDLVQSIELFDIYKGKGIPEGKKSMAYRLFFGSNERTLSVEEVDKAFAAIVEGVKKDAGAQVR